MLRFEEEIQRFKPSLDVEGIEDAITKTDLTDMNDIMTMLVAETIRERENQVPGELVNTANEL